MLRYLIFTGTSTWNWCYATWSSLALQHEIDATLLDLHWHLNMQLTLRYLIFTGTSTWNWCYATWSSLALQMKLMLRYLIFTGTSTWNWCYATWSSLALQHEIDAMLLDLHWHFNMKLMLRYLIFTGTSTWNWCYTTWSSLALQHEIDATLLDLHWHFNMKLMLCYLIFTGTSTWNWCYAAWSSLALQHENKLSGLGLETAHVDGLSALYVHSNLGLECVLDAYASYMSKMLDQMNPKKMFENLDWLKPPALWDQKWKSPPTRNPVRVARRGHFFQKNGVPKISKNGTSWWNETMSTSRYLTNANVQNTHLATARMQFSRKRSHVKNTNELSTTLDFVMNATSTRANLPRQPNMLSFIIFI